MEENPPKRQRVYAGLADSESARLDITVARLVSGLSRTAANKLIVSGQVTVDGEVVRKSGEKLRVGQRLSVLLPAQQTPRDDGDGGDLDVVYEDDAIAVVNKPAGMVVHPAAGHTFGTLANAALKRFGVLAVANGLWRPGIVHRLDRDTSGLVVIAKTEVALNELMAQFRARTVEKNYLALVWGAPPPTGTVSQPIGRDPGRRTRMAIVPAGKPSVSHFRILSQYDRVALVQVILETGRTHQIRVHCAAIGHPVVGDRMYGREVSTQSNAFGGLNRQFLHAYRLTITLPGNSARLSCEASLPADLLAALQAAGDPNPSRWAKDSAHSCASVKCVDD